MKGTEQVAQRMQLAQDNFVEIVQANTNANRVEAVKLLTAYIKNKIVKLDAVGGRYNVKHGAFYDKDVLQKNIDDIRTGKLK